MLDTRTALQLLVTSSTMFVQSPIDSLAVHRAELASRVDSIIEKTIPRGFSGVVLIERRGTPLLHRAYAPATAGGTSNVDTTTAFWIGSLSKQFAAAAVLTLVESGRLRLDDTVGGLFENVPAGKRGIKVEHLLSHTSGLPDAYSLDEAKDIPDALARLWALKLEAEPGWQYRYSNDAYSLAAVIVERASGVPYGRYIREMSARVGAMELRQAGEGASRPLLPVADRSVGARRSGDPQLWSPVWGYRGATGIITTVGALRSWFVALCDGRVAGASTPAMFTTHIATRRRGLAYGLGWYLIADGRGRMVYHSGDDDFIGHSATLRWRPAEELLIIVASNSGYLGARGVAAVVGEAVEGILPIVPAGQALHRESC